MQQEEKDKQVEMRRFRNLLFEEDSATCYTQSPHGTDVAYYPNPEDLFFSINELDEYTDKEPTQEYHSPKRPRRADCNVVCYRNFLIELDGMPLEDQVAYVRSRVPVTSIVFSGSKSYHFIISLETPLATKAEYDDVARRLLALLPAADRSCKNPSRLSRLPFRIRPETGKEQELIYLGERVKNEELIVRLPQLAPQAAPKSPAEVKLLVTPLIMDAADAPDEYIQKLGLQSRNKFFFWLYNRFKDAGMGEEAQWYYAEKAYANLKSTSDFSWEEARFAARLK